MRRIILFGLLLAVACALGLPEQAFGQLTERQAVTGTIVDAHGGEALANVSVQLSGAGGPGLHSVSDAAGKFRLDAVPPGDYVLRVSTVGYHVITQSFQLQAGQAKNFEVVMSPDNLARTDTVDVTAGPFDVASDDSPSSFVLSGNDIKNLASVLADDPLRAIQTVPGVTSNNDFDARFSLRGADYGRIGLYLDDVLLHEPFHMLQGQNVTGSGAAFNGDMVEELELHEGAFPARFGDASAGILDIHTRDGSHTQPTFRVEASASNAGVVAEGPFGKQKRGSWLVATRRSYLQYLIARIDPNGTSLAFGLTDVQGRFSYDFSSWNKVTLYVLESYSSIDRTGSHANLGINSLATGAYNYTLANLGWRFTPSARLVLNSHAAWMREKYDNYTPTPLPQAHGFYGEWVTNTNASWLWGAPRAGGASPAFPGAKLDAGISVRMIRDSGFSVQYQSISAVRLLDQWNGTATETQGYVQQSWSGGHGRIHLTAGAHFDHHSLDGISTASPAVSATLLVTSSTRIQLGWGEYAQHQELSVLTSLGGRSRVLPLRSNQAIGAIEQRINSRTRIRAEFYNRVDRDIAARPLADPRMINGAVFVPPLVPAWENSERGWARGAELFLQRTSANKFTGWISWGWGRTNNHDGVTFSRFPSALDQRNSISVYASYRLRPSVNISIHSSYGSGFPIPGYLTLRNGVYFLSETRNQLRMQYYQRTDIRVNKSWTRDKWKFALYGEVINVSNRTNYLFASLNSYNTKTGQTSVSFDSMFPIVPSVGILIER